MYAHVTFVQIDPEHLEKWLDNIRTTSIPAVKEQPGFEAGLVLCDPHSGKALTIAVFQSEADRQAMEDSGFSDAHRSKTGSLLNIVRSTPEHYEVRIAEGSIRAIEPSAM